jgi:hypothetical protein
VISIFKLRINDLVELYKWRNKLFPHHSLDFSRSMMQPEIIDFVLPSHVLCKFIIDADSSIKLLRKNRADIGLVDINPKGLVVFLFVLLLHQLVKIIEIDHFDFVYCLI